MDQQQWLLLCQKSNMLPFLYRCPTTGYCVQGFCADEAGEPNQRRFNRPLLALDALDRRKLQEERKAIGATPMAIQRHRHDRSRAVKKGLV